MSHELRDALGQIAAAAGDAVAPAATDDLRARVHRRRAVRTVAGSTGVVAGVGGVAVAVLLAATGLPPVPEDLAATTPAPTASPTPSPPPTASPVPTTPLPGWVVGAAPCGQPLTVTPADSPGLEIQGAVHVGTLDPVTAMFSVDAAGDTLFVDVMTTTDDPGEPATGAGDEVVHTYLLDAGGTVAFWDDAATRLPKVEASDGSGASSLALLHGAIDCRTGRPLDGTYRAVAVQADEVLELAPVRIGSAVGTTDDDAPADEEASASASTRPAADLPACGEPAPESLLTAASAAPLAVALDPGVDLGAVSPAGLHAAVTVTSRADDRVRGRVPQALRAVLVDASGMVVTRALSMFGPGYPGGTTFDVAPGESFAAEVYQWFESCPRPDMAGSLSPGDYQLYLYDVLTARVGAGEEASAVAAGGPYPITLIDDGWGS